MNTFRQIPVKPELDQFIIEANELFAANMAGENDALTEIYEYLPQQDNKTFKLADIQNAIAQSYGVESWHRLELACQITDHIWQNDVKKLSETILENLYLINENARGTQKCNWGPPMSYAANLGRDEIINFLIKNGATDFEHALGRAMLQSQIDTAALLHREMGLPPPPDDALGGPAYTLSVAGTEFAIKIGAKVVNAKGERIAPIAVVLETDSRDPVAKHAILELYAQNGLIFPNTPVMALHRGRIDLLEEFFGNNPGLIDQTFSHDEIYPPELGCHDEVLATQGTPLAGTTLLHLCVDYDEFEIAKWLVDRGADVNKRASIDSNGFGGHTALFCSVVSQPNFWMNYQARQQQAKFTELLIKNGADLNIRASLRKKLHPGYSPRFDTENTYEYRDVTALGWGNEFHADVFVSQPALDLIKENGGTL